MPSSSSAYPLLAAEWAPQSAVILTWPHDQSDWAARLGEVEPAFAAIILAIAKEESVLVVCQDSQHVEHVAAKLGVSSKGTSRIRFYTALANDTWVRDYGPLTVFTDGQPQLVDFRFNGWGGKYPAEHDDRITRYLQEQNAFGHTPILYSSIIMEGGSVDTDGEGTLLTTERCLLGPTRNPTMSKSDYERVFKTQLGIDRVLWISNGELQGDDTDGHIDMLARFCDRTTIAYMHCDDSTDYHYAPLAAMRQELQALRTRDNNPYTLIPLPLPPAKYSREGRRLPASYANFLIINNAVLVPTYDDPADAVALANIQRGFPDRKVIGLPCLPIIEQNGSLHCLTMQLPAGVVT